MVISMLSNLGVHIYPIFSPRTNFVVLTWCGMFGLHYLVFIMFNEIIQSSSFATHVTVPLLLGMNFSITVSASLIGFLMLRKKNEIQPPKDDNQSSEGDK